MARDADVLTRLKDVTYLGSHPGKSGQQDKLDITFFTHGVQADRGRSTLMSRRWAEVYELRAEDRDGLERRITAARLLGIGVWAIVFPRKRSLSYLTVADDQGEWIFAIPGLSAIELSSGLRPLQSRVQPRMSQPLSPAPVHVDGSTPVEATADDPAARLVRLQALFDSGLIQQGEFDAKRQEIIDSL